MRTTAEIQKKRGRPGTGIGKALGLRLYPMLESALGSWISAQSDPKPSRPEAIRRLLQAALAADGFAVAPEPGGTIEARIGRLEARLSKPKPSGPPTPEKGMQMLRRGLAENRLRKLKQRKAKTSPKPSGSR